MNDGQVVATARILRRLDEEEAQEVLRRYLTPEALYRLHGGCQEAAIEHGGRLIDNFYADRPWIERRAAGEEQAS